MPYTLVDMDITIQEEKENPFFKRKELSLLLKHPKSATPTKALLIKELASMYKADESQVVVDYIFTKKGISESFAKVKILQEKLPAKEGEKTEAQASKTA